MASYAWDVGRRDADRHGCHGVAHLRGRRHLPGDPHGDRRRGRARRRRPAASPWSGRAAPRRWRGDTFDPLSRPAAWAPPTSVAPGRAVGRREPAVGRRRHRGVRAARRPARRRRRTWAGSARAAPTSARRSTLSSTPTGTGTFVYVTGRRVGSGEEYTVRVPGGGRRRDLGRAGPHHRRRGELPRRGGARARGDLGAGHRPWRRACRCRASAPRRSPARSGWPGRRSRPRRSCRGRTRPRLCRSPARWASASSARVPRPRPRRCASTTCGSRRSAPRRPRRRPNVAPVAAFTATPTGLTVAVDGSASTDSDGTVAGLRLGLGRRHGGRVGRDGVAHLRDRRHVHGDADGDRRRRRDRDHHARGDA